MEAETNKKQQAAALIKHTGGLVYPQLEKDWENTVNKYVKNGTVSNVKDLMLAISVMQAFNSGQTMNDIQSLMQNHSRRSRETLCKLILEFAKGTNGVEFYKKYSNIWYYFVEQDMNITRSNELCERVAGIVKRNKEFEKELSEQIGLGLSNK